MLRGLLTGRKYHSNNTNRRVKRASIGGGLAAIAMAAIRYEMSKNKREDMNAHARKKPKTRKK
jgi:hypothetical protein